MQSTMPNNTITPSVFSDQGFYVGLDVHKKPLSVTVHTSEPGTEHFTQTPHPLQLARHLKNKFERATLIVLRSEI